MISVSKTLFMWRNDSFLLHCTQYTWLSEMNNHSILTKCAIHLIWFDVIHGLEIVLVSNDSYRPLNVSIINSYRHLHVWNRCLASICLELVGRRQRRNNYGGVIAKERPAEKSNDGMMRSGTVARMVLRSSTLLLWHLSFARRLLKERLFMAENW